MSAALPFKDHALIRHGVYADVYRVNAKGKLAVLKIAHLTPDEDVLDATGAQNLSGGVRFLTGNVAPWQPTCAEVIVAEAAALSGMKHPAFVQLLEHAAGERPYLLLEYVPGESWRTLLNRGDRIEFEHLNQVVVALAAGPYFHGDIKPDNLILDPDGRVRIIDPSANLWQVDDMGHLSSAFFTRCYNPLGAMTDMPALGMLLAEITSRQQIFYAGAGRKPRPIGDKLEETLDILRTTGTANARKLFETMPLPREVDSRIPSAVEVLALHAMGLKCEKGVLDIADKPLTLADLSKGLARFS